MWGLATALLLAGAGSALAQNNTGNLNGNYNTFGDNNGNLNGGNSQARERRARGFFRRLVETPPSNSVLRVGQVASGSNNYVSAQAVSPRALPPDTPPAGARCVCVPRSHAHIFLSVSHRLQSKSLVGGPTFSDASGNSVVTPNNVGNGNGNFNTNSSTNGNLNGNNVQVRCKGWLLKRKTSSARLSACASALVPDARPGAVAERGRDEQHGDGQPGAGRPRSLCARRLRPCSVPACSKRSAEPVASPCGRRAQVPGASGSGNGNNNTNNQQARAGPAQTFARRQGNRQSTRPARATA